MIKILPNPEKRKITPYFELVATIGYGEHCDDTYTENTIEIDDEKAGSDDIFDDYGLLDTETYIKCSEAERIVKFIKSVLPKVKGRHIVLNEGITGFWCEGMTKKEIEKLGRIYEKYPELFKPEIEHNWYGITNAEIRYTDENGERFKCEVV